MIRPALNARRASTGMARVVVARTEASSPASRWAVSAVLAAVFMLLFAQWASASLVVYSFKGDLSAQVTFNIVGTELYVNVQNTSNIDVVDPSQLLTGLFFHIWNNPHLQPLEAKLGAGSILTNHAAPANGGLGFEWAYRHSIFGYPNNTSYQGLASDALTIFVGADMVPGPLVNSDNKVEGIDYSITSAVDDPATGTGLIGVPLVKNSIDFRFRYLPKGTTEADIGPVLVQWGPDLACENQSWAVKVVPEPTGLGLLLAAGAMIWRRRRV